MFNLRDRAKRDAWNSVRDKTPEAVIKNFITKVKQLQEVAA